MQQIHPCTCISFQGAECWTDGHTADMSFPLQISETMGAQNERHLQVSMFVDFVNRHQVGSFLYFLFTPKCTLFLSPSLPTCLCHAGYKKDCLCAVGAEQMDFCSRNFNIATASGSVTVTDCSTILMLWKDPAAVIRSRRVSVRLHWDNQNVMTSRLRSPAPGSVAGKWECTVGCCLAATPRSPCRGCFVSACAGN